MPLTLASRNGPAMTRFFRTSSRVEANWSKVIRASSNPSRAMPSWTARLGLIVLAIQNGCAWSDDLRNWVTCSPNTLLILKIASIEQSKDNLASASCSTGSEFRMELPRCVAEVDTESWISSGMSRPPSSQIEIWFRTRLSVPRASSVNNG